MNHNNHTLRFIIDKFSLRIATVLGVVTLIFGANTSMAQSCGAISCPGSVGSGMTCTVAPAFGPCPNYTLVTTPMVVPVSMNAQCNTAYPGAMGTAIHLPSQGIPATCSFSFMKFCVDTGGGTTLILTTFCTIDTVDGLPVELMEFSVSE